MSATRDAGWNSSAKRGATGESYEIATLADFLKVPAHRRRICLREFHAWLTMAEELPKLYEASAAVLGKDAAGWLVPRLETFTWVDDGKGTVSAQITNAGAAGDIRRAFGTETP